MSQKLLHCYYHIWFEYVNSIIAGKKKRSGTTLTVSIGFACIEKWKTEAELCLYTLLTRVKVPSKL